jgi:hypothetical protein
MEHLSTASSTSTTTPDADNHGEQIDLSVYRVSPAPIMAGSRHRTDPNPRRATFKFPYPAYEIALEKKADLTEKLPIRLEDGRRTIRGIRFAFTVPGLFINSSDFCRCQFYIPRTRGVSEIVGTTFTNCTFETCVFGGTTYRHTSFERCHFRRCDFATAHFSECDFQSCTFTECTGEHVSLSATEIDPTALLRGMIPPLYHYPCAIEGEPEAKVVKGQWPEVRRMLAAQLLRSNTEVYNTKHSDKALFELKSAELKTRLAALSSVHSNEGIGAMVGEAARCSMLWLTLVLTKGGTSAGRLLCFGMIAIPSYAVVLSTSSILFQGVVCRMGSIGPREVAQQLTRAISLFLAFGYTSFVGTNLVDLLFLTIGAALGLVWYALMAAVIIRRIYR